MDKKIILLVEDNPDDVDLTLMAFEKSNIGNEVVVARDGVEAVDFLTHAGIFANAERPDIILLDLNLPRMSGREVLERVKESESLRTIPIIILTTSEAEHDIMNAYSAHANCFVTKPVDLDQFMGVLRSVMEFWCNVVKLPPMTYSKEH